MLYLLQTGEPRINRGFLKVNRIDCGSKFLDQSHITRCSVEWSRAQKECGGETHTGNYKRREHTNGNIQSKVHFTLFPELLLWAFNSFIIAFYISISLSRVWNTCVLILRCKVFRLLVAVGLLDLMILNWGVGGHCIVQWVAASLASTY